MEELKNKIIKLFKQNKVLFIGIVIFSLVLIIGMAAIFSKNKIEEKANEPIKYTETHEHHDHQVHFDEDLTEVIHSAIENNNMPFLEDKGEGGHLITEGGKYTITEDITDGIYIQTNDYVELVLDNVNISNPDGPAIVNTSEQSGLGLVIKGNVTVSDSPKREGLYYAKTGAIETNYGMFIKGDGTLTVNSNYKNGIVSKHNLTIDGVTIKSNARLIGILVHKDLKVTNTTLDLTSENRGFKVNRDVFLENTNINIEANGVAYNVEPKENKNSTIKVNGEIGKYKVGTKANEE